MKQVGWCVVGGWARGSVRLFIRTEQEMGILLCYILQCL